MIPVYLSPLANHLWQSTIVVAVCAVLAFLLRNNSARFKVRTMVRRSDEVPDTVFVAGRHRTTIRMAYASSHNAAADCRSN